MQQQPPLQTPRYNSPQFPRTVIRDVTANTKLDALKKREAEIKARIIALEASQKAKARKEDTRLKVLVGAAILADIDLHPETRAGVEAVLKRAITAPRDREFLQSKGWL